VDAALVPLSRLFGGPTRMPNVLPIAHPSGQDPRRHTIIDSPADPAWAYGSKDQDREMGAVLGARPIDQACTSAHRHGSPGRRLSLLPDPTDQSGHRIETYGSEGGGSNPSGCAIGGLVRGMSGQLDIARIGPAFQEHFRSDQREPFQEQWQRTGHSST
jgi:hypothetical protein